MSTWVGSWLRLARAMGPQPVQPDQLPLTLHGWNICEAWPVPRRLPSQHSRPERYQEEGNTVK